MSVAVITGASSGIGREFLVELAKLDEITEFWLIARRKELLEQVAAEVDKPCKLLCLDLSNNEGLNAYKNALESEKPEILYLVNSAGYGKYGSYEVVDTNTAFNMIDLNVKALLFVTQESINYMTENSHIIQLGSASTYHPLPNFNVYASTKSFVKHYSLALHYELKPRKISVTTVCPGWVKTEFFNRAHIETDNKQSFAKPMVMAKDVVKKAIKDAKRNKKISMYALFNNTHFMLSKLLPQKILIKMWQIMQKS